MNQEFPSFELALKNEIYNLNLEYINEFQSQFRL